MPPERGTQTGDELDDELAVALELLPVHDDGSAAAEVEHHVPVHRRVVLAARLRIARADRHVHRAADLLVEEDLLRAGGDAVVRADAELAKAAGAVVGVKHLDEEVLPALGGGVHDPAVLEAEPHAGNLAAA